MTIFALSQTDKNTPKPMQIIYNILHKILNAFFFILNHKSTHIVP